MGEVWLWLIRKEPGPRFNPQYCQKKKKKKKN